MNTLESILASDMDADIDYNLIVTYGPEESRAIRCVEVWKGTWSKRIDFTVGTNPVRVDLRDADSIDWGPHPALKSVEFLDFKGEHLDTAKESFMNCRGLERVSLPEFRGDRLESVDHCFSNNYKLERIDAPKFTGKALMDAELAFQHCQSLKSLDLPAFTGSHLEAAAEAFYGCRSLESVNLPKFKGTKLQDIRNCFFNCYRLKEINLPELTGNISNAQCMFYECSDLRKVSLPKLTGAYDINLNGMFYECRNLEYIDITSLVSRPVTIGTVAAGIFDGCKKLKTIVCSQYFKDYIMTCETQGMCRIPKGFCKRINWIIK